MNTNNIDLILEEIRQIKGRNRRVEAEKAWEVSWSRRIVVAIATYFVIVIFFSFAQVPNPWVNSIVPTIAFLLSTSSFPFLKNLWLKYIYKNNLNES